MARLKHFSLGHKIIFFILFPFQKSECLRIFSSSHTYIQSSMYQESCMTVMQSKKALKRHTFHQVQHFSQFFWHLFKLSCWCCWYIAALGVLDRAPQKDPSQLVKAAADSSPEP